MATMDKVTDASGVVTEALAHRGWQPVVPSAQAASRDGGGEIEATSPPPGPTPDDLRTAASLGALEADLRRVTRNIPQVRWLKVDLAEIDRPGFYVSVRLSFNNVMLQSIHMEKPETMVWLFGEHNLVYEDDMPDLVDPFATADDGSPLVIAQAHQAGDTLPPGGTLDFVQHMPQDILRYAFGQATLTIVRGGRTEKEKKG